MKWKWAFKLQFGSLLNFGANACSWYIANYTVGHEKNTMHTQLVRAGSSNTGFDIPSETIWNEINGCKMSNIIVTTVRTAIFQLNVV
jgi:hypothetical protein